MTNSNNGPQDIDPSLSPAEVTTEQEENLSEGNSENSEAVAGVKEEGESVARDAAEIAEIERQLGISKNEEIDQRGESRGEMSLEKTKSNEAIYTDPTAEQLAMYEAYMAEHPEPEIAEEDPTEHEKKVTELETLCANFEATHDIKALYEILTLDPNEAPNHPTREPARVALNPIRALLNSLGKSSNISPKKLEELRAKYKYFSRAVGMINHGKVDHER
jgi:hypothetical protein